MITNVSDSVKTTDFNNSTFLSSFKTASLLIKTFYSRVSIYLFRTSHNRKRPMQIDRCRSQNQLNEGNLRGKKGVYQVELIFTSLRVKPKARKDNIKEN